MMNSGTTPKNKGPKACKTCAKAKARCMPGPEGSIKCERCHRLDKPCLSQTPAPPRARKSPKLSKVAALEKRLEELSSQVNQESPANGSTPPVKKPRLDASKIIDQWSFQHLFPTRDEITTSASIESKQEPTPTISATSTPTPTPTSTVQPESWSSWWPTASEADVLLANYMSAHSQLFPFVLVPQHISAYQLKQDRPLIWKAIMMVACFLDGTRQLKLGQDLLADIGKAAIADGLKSLDLLQALQLLVAWFHYALKGAQITNLLFLARSMCVYLGFKDDSTLQGEEMTRNLDCMRAYAGTYYLNTLVSNTNKRPDVLTNTTFLETCCRVLETTRQYPSDEYLVKLVRIQQLAQSISLTMTVENLGQQAMNLPLTIMVRSFQDQLDQFSISLGRYADNDALKGHISVAQVLLYEIAISEQHSTASFVPLTDRLQLLWACLRSLKSFFDIRFAHRELERPRFLCLSASDYVYAIITGLKLVMLQLPGWSPTHIQEEIDMLEVMDQQIRDLIVIVTRRKQGIFRDTAPSSITVEDPFASLLCRLRTLRDLTKIELERDRLCTGAADTPAMDIHPDFVNNAPSNDFWQGFGGPEIWRLIGDPTVLYENTAPQGAIDKP